MASGDLLTSLRVLADRLKNATPFESERLSAELMKLAMGETGFRCATCRWWLAGEMDRTRGIRLGTCTRRADGPYPGFSTETMDFSTRPADLYTDSDFGCIKWEARDE